MTSRRSGFANGLKMSAKCVVPLGSCRVKHISKCAGLAVLNTLQRIEGMFCGVKDPGAGNVRHFIVYKKAALGWFDCFVNRRWK